MVIIVIQEKKVKGFKKGQDTIQFKQYVYGKRSREGVTAGVLADRVFGNPVDGSVTLSIPTGIRDANRVNWSGQDANALQVELAKSSLQMMDNFGQGSKGLVTRATDAVSDPATQDNIKTILAGKAAGLNNAMARFNGAILNPNTELLFGGPGLRDFAYTIEMTPRSPDEAQHIRDIIRFFKEGMAVRRSVNGLFLQLLMFLILDIYTKMMKM